MPHLRISKAAELLGVSDDTLRRWVDQGKLTAQADDAGRLGVDGVELAAFAQERANSEHPSGISARNAFEGMVTRIICDTVMSQVELQCGPYRVVALISTEAVQELGLVPGALATARVKATHVIVERGSA
ncbi:TOBE domain-containing protein [Aestuariimicrobium ganziense]|uniref:TOBE domain-containing protein n=1 Tax=Aestuariimicrobium ganziense TaxID=2773677 RepID=UPI001940F26B|nr:helix-turn-helix transcriptional regulator [Aestuariimicrobium ganziense]